MKNIEVELMRIGQYEITLRSPIHIHRYPTEEEIKKEFLEISEREFARISRFFEEHYKKYGYYPEC